MFSHLSTGPVHSGSAVARISGILDEAGLSPPPQIPILGEPPTHAFESFNPEDLSGARNLLVQQRVSEPGYRKPEQQKRHVFRSKKSKEAETNTENWIFTKHEVGRAFNTLLSRTPLPVPGVARALLSHASVVSLDELWNHFCNPNLKDKAHDRSKRPISNVLPSSKSVFALRAKSSVALGTPDAQGSSTSTKWLDQVCDQDNIEYIHLMCQAGVSQDALSRAFRIALQRYSLDAMKVLLNFGAVYSTACKDAIQNRIKLHDVSFVKLLLSVPNALNAGVWQRCLEPETQSWEAEWIPSNEILLLCFAHRPEIVSSHLLRKALQLQDLPVTAIMLAYGRFHGEYFRDFRQLACSIATRIEDHGLRYKFFKMLVASEFVADDLALQEELLKDVKAREIPLTKILVDAGVNVDIDPHNSLEWAITQLDFDMLEIFKTCKLTLPISRALEYAPQSASESDMLRLIGILGPVASAGGQSLTPYLTQAIRNRHKDLAAALLLYSTPAGLDQAIIVRIALANADFDMLTVLLNTDIPAKILSTTIPTALKLQPRTVRLQAMKALIQKGVLAPELGVALQFLVCDESDIDIELIETLILHGAPVDGTSDDARNVVLVATKTGNLSLLKLVHDHIQDAGTISKAVALAGDTMDSYSHGVALEMIELLLRKKVTGVSINQTLLAAVERGSMELIQLLLRYGADANSLSGACFSVALKASNFAMLQLLCEKCPIDPKGFQLWFMDALSPTCYSAETLELLLSSGPDKSLSTIWSSEKMTGNPNIGSIVPCLIRHGMDVNLGKGDLLVFAINEKDTSLLTKILAEDPSLTSLTFAFHAAARIKARTLELDIMKLLLEQAKSADIGQSQYLVKQVEDASANNNFAGLRLFLLHKPKVRQPLFFKACLLVASSMLSWDERQELLDALFEARTKISTEELSAMLGRCLAEPQNTFQLPEALLANGAQVDFSGLKIGALTKPQRFEALVKSASLPVIIRTFSHLRRVKMDPERRYEVYQILLSEDIPSEEVSETLLQVLKEPKSLDDLSLLKLLLENGASPGYKKGAFFSLVLREKSPNSLVVARLLTQSIVDDNTAAVAFRMVSEATGIKEDARQDIYRSLLAWNIGEAALTPVLLKGFEDAVPELNFLEMLLARGANPNKHDGHCFFAAAKAGAVPQFRALSQRTSPSVVFKLLLNHFDNEANVVEWVKVCLEGQPKKRAFDKDQSVFLCMQKFPKGVDLLQLLLDHGASLSTKLQYSLRLGWDPEPCTPLIWALFAKHKIADRTILTLLSRGADVLPAYVTPVTNVSAAFGCLLDKSRLPILMGLLELDRDRVLEYTIPGSSFAPLSFTADAAKVESDLLDPSDRLPLREASLYLGNFEAFRLLATEMIADDGTLHLASLLALPRFVEWLLDFHSPNYKAEEFDNMIPLACVCAAKPHPWSKIANEESDFKKRQRKTMVLLAGMTDEGWRYRNMTILHWAIENGVETAKMMLAALNVKFDLKRDKKYLYKDRDGIEYSPQQYVMQMWGGEDEEKKELVLALGQAGLKSKESKKISLFGSYVGEDGDEDGDDDASADDEPEWHAAKWSRSLSRPSSSKKSIDFDSGSRIGVERMGSDTSSFSPWWGDLADAED